MAFAPSAAQNKRTSKPGRPDHGVIVPPVFRFRTRSYAYRGSKEMPPAAFVVVVHVLGAVLYLSFFDLLSRRWAFALEPPSVIRLHSSLLVLTIPIAVLIYVLQRKKGKLLSGSVFRVIFVGFGILFFVVALLAVLIPAPLIRST
jgi:hypothetical protein